MTIGAARPRRVQHDDFSAGGEHSAPSATMELSRLFEIMERERSRQVEPESEAANGQARPRRRSRDGHRREEDVVRAPRRKDPSLFPARSCNCQHKKIRSFVCSLIAASGTVLVLAAALSAIGTIPNSFANGPEALRRSIGEWHARGADRLMTTMLQRQRRLVLDAAEESAAHEVVADEEIATSPVVPPIIPVAFPVAPPTVHHRRIEVTATGLARLDLSALSPTADAPEGVVVEGIPTGLVPMTGTAVDDRRWMIDNRDLADFALVLGVNPPEQFELRLARYSGTNNYRPDTSIVVDLVAKPPAAEPAPAPVSEASLPPARTQQPPTVEQSAAVEKPAARRKVRKSKADPATAARKVIAPSGGVTIAAPRTKAMGVGMRPSRTAKAVTKGEAAAEVPWWSKPAPFKIEDSTVQR